MTSMNDPRSPDGSRRRPGWLVLLVITSLIGAIAAMILSGVS